MMIAKRQSRLVVSFIIISMLLQAFVSVPVFAQPETADEAVLVSAPASVDDDGITRTLNSLNEMKDLMVSTTYAEYHELYGDIPKATETITIKATDYDRELTTAKVEIREDSEKGETLWAPDLGKTVYTVEVPATGRYAMTVDYYPCEGNGSNIERIILIDGKVPFAEARNISFTRIWGDREDGTYSKEERVFKKDFNGNEMRPVKYEVPEWRTEEIYDSESFFTTPLEFYLTEGTHTIAFEAACEPIQTSEIRLHPASEYISYEEYSKMHADKKAPDAEPIYINAETPIFTSEQVLYAMNDRTSGLTEPQSTSATLLNTIGGNGGDKWKISGQWIKYDFKVEKAGMYDIVLRFRQTVNQGLFSSRAIKIDGEYPFEEAKQLQFQYDADWQVDTLNDGTTHFSFYLDEGEHTVEFKTVLGDMADILNTISDSQTRLNEYYRKILMITGSEPDEYTDYEFAKLIPEVLRGMRDEAKLLYSVSSELEAKIGTKGQNTVILDRIAFLLETMGNDQDKIATNLSNYKSNIGSLGTWLLSTKGQPLQLDYIKIQPAGSALPKANTNFFQSMAHEIGSFFMSFFTDYNSLGASKKIEEDDPDVVEVWVTTGRDQAQIMRQMVDDSFTAETGIAVNLKLIAAGTLLPATLAGVGPDVSMDGDPVGFGIRNAVVPVNYFADFETEVKPLFNEEQFVPLTVLDPDRIEYADGTKADQFDEQKEYKVVNGIERNGVVTYGLPSTLDFPMLFYRKDIFVDLGLKVPETWDDVEAVIRALSENQMEMGFSQAMTQIYMYQSDIEWFKSCYDYEGIKGDRTDREYMRTVGMATNLDSNGALDAFQRMTEWFTLYGEPITYDFANRFRTGEMPIAIANYTVYNQLKVFAPEIAGLWEFVQLPGVAREDGSINHTSPVVPHAMMMMKDAINDISEDQDVTESNKAKKSWEYLKWWVNTPAQERFGKEQVAIMGTAAKYNTANVEALIGQSWTAQEKRNLEQQFLSLKGTPMSPGNYIVARYTNFAFYAVVDDDEVASEAMLGYVDDINHELSRKRDEYGFLTLEEYQEEKAAEGETV